MNVLTPTHLILLLLVALLLFGAKRLPEIGRGLGTGMKEFKESVSPGSGDDNPEAGSELPPPAATAAPVQAPPAPVESAPAETAPTPPAPAAPAPPAPGEVEDAVVVEQPPAQSVS